MVILPFAPKGESIVMPRKASDSFLLSMLLVFFMAVVMKLTAAAFCQAQLVGYSLNLAKYASPQAVLAAVLGKLFR